MEKTIYIFTYTAYDEEGLYTQAKAFDTLEKAQAEMKAAINNEVTDEYCHFGGIYKDVCDSNLDKFEEDFVIEKSDVSYHIADDTDYGYYINFDIFTQIVK